MQHLRSRVQPSWIFDLGNFFVHSCLDTSQLNVGCQLEFTRLDWMVLWLKSSLSYHVHFSFKVIYKRKSITICFEKIQNDKYRPDLILTDNKQYIKNKIEGLVEEKEEVSMSRAQEL